MSLYRRTDSPHWWVKIGHSGRTIQHSTGTEDKAQAREYHDKLKASLWEQERLGVKPRRSWKEAVIRWLAETSEKVTHGEDIRKLRWLDSFLGNLMLDEITLDVIDGVKTEKLKTAEQGDSEPLPGTGKSHPSSFTRRVGMARQGAESEAPQGGPRTGTVDHRGTSTDASGRVAGASAGHRDVRAGDGVAARQCARSGVVTRGPRGGSCLG